MTEQIIKMKVEINLKGKKIELTEEEAYQIHIALARIFKKPEMAGEKVLPIPYPVPSPYPVYPYLPTVTWCSDTVVVTL